MEENQKNYFGIIQVIDIHNFIPKDLEEDSILNPIPPFTEKNIKIVHYNDCQQIILWLPEHGMFYDDLEIIWMPKGTSIYSEKIDNILGGSVHILIDSLFIPPGKSRLEITKKDGVRHIIQWEKFEFGILPEIPKLDAESNKSDSEQKNPIVYRDGFGKIIPDEDLIMRENALMKIYEKFSRKLEFKDQGRSSTITFIQGDQTASFYSEIGGGDCLFYIDIPTAEEWEQKTGFPRSERDEIVRFIADTALRKQTVSSGSYYEINDRDIVFKIK
ncbi:MAG: hypothetical protein IPM48_00910 [Saprospiraceae bacterium]|nr:hypothetical protein [Saprospiraceae bacterium]